LWKQSTQTKLLQRPPADRISAKNRTLHEQTYHETATLGLCLDEVLQLQSEESLQLAEDLLQATLAARPVATLAQLLVWLQQRPELLQLPQQAAQQPGSVDESSYCTLWMCCSRGELYGTAMVAAVAAVATLFPDSSASSSSSSSGIVKPCEILHEWQHVWAAHGACSWSLQELL
jgi:hypothetical protein